MKEIASVILPVFGLIGVGYVVAWLRLLPNVTATVLSQFVFVVAVPFLMFRTMVAADFANASPWRLWFSYFVAMAIAWGAGTLTVRALHPSEDAPHVIGGFSAAYSNSVMIGIPLIMTAYGEEAIVALLILVAVHLPIAMTVGTLLMGRADRKGSDADKLTVAREVGGTLATNPVLIGVVAALLWRSTGMPVPDPLAWIVGRLAEVAGPVALFAVGMSIRERGLAGEWPSAAFLSTIKLAVMPTIAFVLAFYLAPIPVVWAKAIVLAAACPTGIYAFVAASRFRSGEALSSATILMSTIAAVATVSFWLIVLQRF
ncbi:MAG: AEC family transporter [Propylenella sp.]